MVLFMYRLEGEKSGACDPQVVGRAEKESGGTRPLHGWVRTVTTQRFIQSVHYEHRTDADNPDSCVSHRVTAMPEHHVKDVQCDHLDALWGCRWGHRTPVSSIRSELSDGSSLRLQPTSSQPHLHSPQTGRLKPHLLTVSPALPDALR